MHQVLESAGTEINCNFLVAHCQMFSKKKNKLFLGHPFHKLPQTELKPNRLALGSSWLILRLDWLASFQFWLAVDGILTYANGQSYGLNGSPSAFRHGQLAILIGQSGLAKVLVTRAYNLKTSSLIKDIAKSICHSLNSKNKAE